MKAKYDTKRPTRRYYTRHLYVDLHRKVEIYATMERVSFEEAFNRLLEIAFQALKNAEGNKNVVRS